MAAGGAALSGFRAIAAVMACELVYIEMIGQCQVAIGTSYGFTAGTTEIKSAVAASVQKKDRLFPLCQVVIKGPSSARD